MNNVIKNYTARYQIPFFRKKTIWTVTASTSAQDMSSKISDLRGERIVHMYTTSWGTIKVVDGQDYMGGNYTAQSQSGNPKKAWWGTYQTLEFSRKFNATSTVHTTYFRKHTTVAVTSTATIDWPEEHEDLLEHETLMLAYDALEDDRLVIEERRRDKSWEAFMESITGEDPEELR
jgi:hypothetical protein